MSYIDELLISDERVVRITRDHWITLLTTILVDVVLSVVIIGLSVMGVILFPPRSGGGLYRIPPWTWFGFLLLLAPLGHFLLRFIEWWSTRYIVTNRRIIQISGTVSTRVSDTSLEKVNDIVMEQSAMGRLLKFGDLEIISGSESGIDKFRHIADPIGFKKDLLDQKAGLVGLDVFEERAKRVLSTEAPSAGDVPELIAELDELRQKKIITDAEFEKKKQELLDVI
jgi:uncharacterized membrane protein YdbT with pleckstrin-like domain